GRPYRRGPLLVHVELPAPAGRARRRAPAGRPGRLPVLAGSEHLMHMSLRLWTLALALFPAIAAAQAVVTVARSTASGVSGELRYTGTVTAEHEAALSPRVAGLVSAVRVD